MKQTVIFFAIVIGLFLYWFMGTINGIIEDTDVSYGEKEKAVVLGETKGATTGTTKGITSFDEEGNELIVLHDISLAEKKRLWNNSDLKIEMLKLFPQFVAIKAFIKERIEDDGDFKKRLLEHVEQVEFQYVGASITAKEAKKKLSNF
jgi:hypothetical protein